MTMDDRSSKIERIRARLIAGYSAEEFAEMRCPVCEATLAFAARPNRRDFFLRCTVNSGHVAIHDTAADDPPAWWKAHEINGWYQ